MSLEEKRLIDANTLYKTDEHTFSQLSVHFETGRSFVISGTGRDRKYRYRTGYMTEIGDIESAQWEKMVKYLIERSEEQTLQESLLTWVKENCPWLHNQKEQELYSLSLHASRIFDHKDWVHYEKFNKKYRPEMLQDAKEEKSQNACL